MTSLLSALLFSLTSNLDNVVIGMAYGIKKIKIGILANLLIALITTLGTLLSMTAGKLIAELMPVYISNIAGALIIIGLGLYFLMQSLLNLKNKKETNELALKDAEEAVHYAEVSDKDKSGDLNLKEAFFVAMGLTINNLGTGIAASITGVNIQITVLFTFILSLVMMSVGRSIGHNVLGKVLGKYAPMISGILLIILGLFECFN